MGRISAAALRAFLIAPACLPSLAQKDKIIQTGRVHEPDPHKHMQGCKLYEDEEHVPTSAMAATGALKTCNDGLADGQKSCHNIDQYSFIPGHELDNELDEGPNASDCWGWTDPMSGREFAIICMSSGTTFVEITDPLNPVRIGGLKTKTTSSSWRDVKVYNEHAFIVSEASGHGMQVFDLKKLLTESGPVTLTEDAHYSDFGNAHNIAINEASGYAYAVGTNTCAGGLHIINIQNPTSPVYAGCFGSDGYTHDVQCVNYQGPDTAYLGREICFASNEDTVTIVDVTNKNNPVQISKTGYSGEQYTHQGWLTEDHRYFLFGDELDEYYGGTAFGTTKTLVMDVQNLDNPISLSSFRGTDTVIDHNMYIKGDLVFQANYRAGIQVYRMNDMTNPATGVQQVAHFDTSPSYGSTNRFNGAWSNYPFFPSGKFIVSDIEEGLYVLGFSSGFEGPTNEPTSSPVLDAPTSSPVHYTDAPTRIPTGKPTGSPINQPAPTTCSGIDVELVLTTDNYGEETSWNVVDNNGEVLYSRSTSYYESGQTYEEQMCLTGLDPFVFTIFDSFNDGICCGFGTGMYALSVQGIVVHENGDFGSQDSYVISDDAPDGFWAICGKTGRCSETEKADNPNIKHEVRCCSDVPLENWVKQNWCVIWGESKFGDNGICHHEKTHDEAKNICANYGGRLCTKTELENDCTSGSGCSHDSDLIWSSTPGTEKAYVVCGKGTGDSLTPCTEGSVELKPVDETHEVRCCSEVALSGWSKKRGCSVWGESIFEGQCYHDKTFAEAQMLCQQHGGRLCTRAELQDSCTKGTGCNHDNDMVWSSELDVIGRI